jgi:uncharacterized protein
MNALVIFSKTPELGKTKTRLGKEITMQAAKDLHMAFLKDLLKEHTNQSYELIVYATTHCFPMSEVTHQDITFMLQQGKGLGERMLNTFRELLGVYDNVIIIGSDMPQLSSTTIQQAFDTLQEHDIVLGPSQDGGYYLVGMHVPHNIFQDVSWSTPQVLCQTQRNIQEKSLRLAFLKEGYDLDTFSSLMQFKHDFKEHTRVEETQKMIQEVLKNS